MIHTCVLLRHATRCATSFQLRTNPLLGICITPSAVADNSVMKRGSWGLLVLRFKVRRMGLMMALLAEFPGSAEPLVR